MKKLLCALLAFTMLFSLAACGCKHEWAEATCTEPKTCTLCGETEGEVLPHDWSEASCTEPKTCALCGETEGEVLPHDWSEAGCTEPKTCTLCGETEGEALGHQLFIMEESISLSEMQKLSEGECSVCNQIVTETAPLEALHDDEAFFYTPEDYLPLFIEQIFGDIGLQYGLYEDAVSVFSVNPSSTYYILDSTGLFCASVNFAYSISEPDKLITVTISVSPDMPGYGTELFEKIIEKCVLINEAMNEDADTEEAIAAINNLTTRNFNINPLSNTDIGSYVFKGINYSPAYYDEFEFGYMSTNAFILVFQTKTADEEYAQFR